MTDKDGKMKHAPETIDRVRFLASIGLTAREIAERAGLCSRDAVIGVCNRYGIRLLVPKSEGWRYHRYKVRFNEMARRRA